MGAAIALSLLIVVVVCVVFYVKHADNKRNQRILADRLRKEQRRFKTDTREKVIAILQRLYRLVKKHLTENERSYYDPHYSSLMQILEDDDGQGISGTQWTAIDNLIERIGPKIEKKLSPSAHSSDELSVIDPTLVEDFKFLIRDVKLSGEQLRHIRPGSDNIREQQRVLHDSARTRKVATSLIRRAESLL